MKVPFAGAAVVMAGAARAEITKSTAVAVITTLPKKPAPKPVILAVLKLPETLAAVIKLMVPTVGVQPAAIAILSVPSSAAVDFTINLSATQVLEMPIFRVPAAVCV